MYKTVARRIVKALRSGEYKQATEVLFDEATGGYCCLGVAVCVVSGIEGDDIRQYAVDNDLTKILDEDFKKKVGGFPDTEQQELATQNDGGKTFAEIADLIEKWYIKDGD